MTVLETRCYWAVPEPDFSNNTYILGDVDFLVSIFFFLITEKQNQK